MLTKYAASVAISIFVLSSISSFAALGAASSPLHGVDADDDVGQLKVDATPADAAKQATEPHEQPVEAEAPKQENEAAVFQLQNRVLEAKRIRDEAAANLAVAEEAVADSEKDAAKEEYRLWEGKKPEKTDGKTLVIVIGTLRGGEMAWHSMQKHFLDPWGADLAVMTDLTKSEIKATSLMQRAKFQWHEPEHKDWGLVLDSIPGANLSWRRMLCRQDSQFLGGVLYDDIPTKHRCQHPGSAGILLAYRWLVAQKLKTLQNAGVSYESVVLTRSDYLYLCDVPNRSEISAHIPESGLAVPVGQEFGGFTDRFAFMPNMFVAEKSLGVSEYLVSHKGFWEILEHKPHANLEKLLAAYWSTVGIKVSQFRHPAFTVSAPTDKTSWMYGGRADKDDNDPKQKNLNEYQLRFKYGEEMEVAERACSERHISTQQALKALALEVGLQKSFGRLTFRGEHEGTENNTVTMVSDDGTEAALGTNDTIVPLEDSPRNASLDYSQGNRLMRRDTDSSYTASSGPASPAGPPGPGPASPAGPPGPGPVSPGSSWFSMIEPLFISSSG